MSKEENQQSDSGSTGGEQVEDDVSAMDAAFEQSMAGDDSDVPVKEYDNSDDTKQEEEETEDDEEFDTERLDLTSAMQSSEIEMMSEEEAEKKKQEAAEREIEREPWDERDYDGNDEGVNHLTNAYLIHHEEAFKDRFADVSLSALEAISPAVVRHISNNPHEAMGEMRDAAHAARSVIDDVDVEDIREPSKDGWDVRLIDPPEWMYIRPSEPHSDYIGEMVALRGRIATYTHIETFFEQLVLKCRRCGEDNLIPQSLMGGIDKPHECRGCERGNQHLNPDDTADANEKTSQQTVVVEELLSQTDGGRAEKMSIEVWGDSRCSSYQMGAEADVVGVLRHDFDNESTFVEGFSVLPDEKIGDIEITDDDIEEIERLIEQFGPLGLAEEAVAPHVIGHGQAKRATVLSMASSVDDGAPAIHTMLVGDRGTAKSEISDYATQIALRGRFLDSASTTEAGVKGSAKRDDTGQRTRTMIEGGVLPKYHQGVVAFDELDQLPWSVNALKTPIERGEVTIDKDGVSETMAAKTCIIATANPSNDTDTFNPHEEMEMQIPIMGAVGDRFDLVFPFVADEDNDELHVQISDAIGDQFVDFDEDDDESDVVITKELARKWIHLARETEIDRKTHHEANQELMRKVTRKFGGGDRVSLTNRQKRAVWQLAGGIVRLRMGDEVRPEDMKKSVKVMTQMLNLWKWDVQGANAESPASSTGQQATATDGGVNTDSDEGSDDDVNEKELERQLERLQDEDDEDVASIALTAQNMDMDAETYVTTGQLGMGVIDAVEYIFAHPEEFL